MFSKLGCQILHPFWLRRISMKPSQPPIVPVTDSPPASYLHRCIVTGDLHLSAVRGANLGQFQCSDGGDGGLLTNSDYAFHNSDGVFFQNSRHNLPPYDRTRNHFISASRPHPYHQLPADYREWECTDSSSISQNQSFRILSYNLLADYLANSHNARLYRHIPPHILQWQWRKTCIIAELGCWSSDLMCFQEVDKFQDIESELRIHGYSGIWKRRTGDSVDGCAIFWRNSRFNLLHEESIEFSKLGLRDNIAQICVLEMVDPGGGKHKLVLSNTHILYNPKRGDVKLGQVRVLLERVHTVSKNWGGAPVILCGDFNCTPASPLYNFIAHQKLDFTNLSRYDVSGQASAEIHPWINSSLRDAGMAFQLKRGLSFRRFHEKEVPTLNSGSGSNSTEAHCSDERDEPEGKGQGISSATVLLSDERSEGREDGLNNGRELDTPDVSNGVAGGQRDEPVQENKNSGEDCDKFISELHGRDDDSKVSGCSGMGSAIEELDGGVPAYRDRVYRDPRKWTDEERERATGSREQHPSIMEHPLKLTSTYTEGGGLSGMRDSVGEPVATSYNRCFFGTVDYIWRCEGLRTVAVLGPIPKNAMTWTEGFPTPKWGSDHIALVSELTFIDERGDCGIYAIKHIQLDMYGRSLMLLMDKNIGYTRARLMVDVFEKDWVI